MLVDRCPQPFGHLMRQLVILACVCLQRDKCVEDTHHEPLIIGFEGEDGRELGILEPLDFLLELPDLKVCGLAGRMRSARASFLLGEVHATLKTGCKDRTATLSILL